MGPALRGAAVIQGGQGRPPLQSKTGTVQNGTAGTPCPTHSVIARSEATRQSVLPSPKRRIPTPVCTPRALASRRALARDDSAARCERRDTWVPPYGVRRSSTADGVVRPYKAKQEPCETGRRGRRPLHTLSLRGAKRRGNPFSPAQRDGFPRQCVPQGHLLRGAHWRGNDSAARWERRDTWVPPYGVRRSSRAGGGIRPYKAEQKPRKTGRRGRRPLRNHKGCVQWAGRVVRPYNGTAGTACPTNRRGAARTAKFRNFFFPLSASAGLRRLYSDDTGRPPVL